MYDYKLLHALAMVVQEGGFERAARAMHLTQSAVSQRLKLLEDELGQPLVVRSSPPRPTHAGKVLIRHFRQVELLEHGLQDLAPDHGDDTLRIAVNADGLSTWFMPAIAGFMQRENVLLDLHVADEESTHRLLRDGDVIGCISARRTAIQGCRVQRLGRMRHRLVGTPDFYDRYFADGVTAAAVATAPLLVFNRDDALHRRLFDAAPERPDRYRLHVIPSLEQCSAVIRSGLACGMLSDAQAGSDLSDGTLLDLAPGLHVDVQLYWHSWNLHVPVVSRLTETLLREAPLHLDPFTIAT